MQVPKYCKERDAMLGMHGKEEAQAKQSKPNNFISSFCSLGSYRALITSTCRHDRYGSYARENKIV